MGDTKLREEASIFTRRSRSIAISAHQKATRGFISTGDGDQTTAMNRGSLSWFTIAAKLWPDRHAIVAQWPHDHGQFTVRFRPRSPLTYGPRLAIKSISWPDPMVLKSRRNFPLKTNVLPCFLLNSWLIREAIQQIWSKILSSSWFPCV